MFTSVRKLYRGHSIYSAEACAPITSMAMPLQSIIRHHRRSQVGALLLLQTPVAEELHPATDGLYPQKSIDRDVLGESYQYTMDGELWLRLCVGGGCARLNRILAADRHHAARNHLRDAQAFRADQIRVNSKYEAPNLLMASLARRAAWRLCWRTGIKLIPKQDEGRMNSHHSNLGAPCSSDSSCHNQILPTSPPSAD